MSLSKWIMMSTDLSQRVPPFGKGGTGGICSPTSKANPPKSPFFKGGLKSCTAFVGEWIDVRNLLIAACLAAIAFPALPAWAEPAGHPPALAPERQFAQRLDNLPGLANVGRVAPGIYRGAQPGKEGYATLKRLGIRTVIDLRTTEDERARVEGAGMRAIAVPLRMSRDGLKEKVDRVVDLMADPANQPVFVHCRHGQDRTGIVVAAYRMRKEGWSLTAAEAEMDAFGFNHIWVNFKRFIRQYGAQNQNQFNTERR